MADQYDEKYDSQEYYWGKKPSRMCYRALDMAPPVRRLKLLDIGCGERRNAVFFAGNGYEVTAFDSSRKGIEKTRAFAAEAGVRLTAFQADMAQYRLDSKFDIMFSSGALHYLPEDKRGDIITHYLERTSENGLHVFSVFVTKPFIPKAPDAEETARHWISGELFTHYAEWEILYCTEEIFDCLSGGVPHKHAINRIIAKKP